MPVVATLVLVVSCTVFAEPFSGPYLILALLAFTLTFHSYVPMPGIRRSITAEAVGSWLVVASLLLMLGWATRTLDVFDLRVIGAWLVATPVALSLVHGVLPRWLPRLMSATGMQRVAIVAGGCELAHRLVTGIRQSPQLGVHVAGIFDDRESDRLHPGLRRDILGDLGNLASYAKKHHVDLIYITLPMTSQARILRLADELRDTTASIYFVPDIFLFDLIQARMDTVCGLPMVAVCETPYYGVNALIKRGSDLVLATLILILIAPLMLAIAIAVKRSSPGPILFKQRRYGLDGREIVIYKFRSMTVQEDGDQIRQATRNDSRVTRLGAFLRATSLDELPQFINVLQGRMSVVGPRPHAVAHNELYRKLINGYMIRHKVRPGITGWAQVNGLRGETETVERMKARIEYDLAYLRHWSLPLDLQIIFKTLFVVLKKENAY
ncbi:undecaprenyl-phosphate glucose phosphotransferase [Denitratisoma sp. DHT3]|nr:undecaprenyl-phosphate glucose phosphotransferase [Denitratisoma sp. DHT3]